MIVLLKKSLNLQILISLALILVTCFTVLCFVILNRQENLLREMYGQVNGQLTEAEKTSVSHFTRLEEKVMASLSAMNKQVTGSLLLETEKSLTEESGFVNRLLEDQVKAHGAAIADLIANVGRKSLLMNDLTRISEISRAGSTAGEITFILFLDKADTPLPSYINRVDDRIVRYLKELRFEDDGVRDERVEEIKAVIAGAQKDPEVYVHTQKVEYFNNVIGSVLVGVDKSLIMKKIDELNSRFDALRAGNDRLTRQVMAAEADEVTARIADSLEEVRQDNRKTMDETDKILAGASEQVKRDTTYAVILGGLISCLAILILISLILRFTVLRPIAGITDGLKDAAEGEGDLTKRLHSSRLDEIGTLAGWFDSFVERLNSIIVKIGKNSETVTSSSLEVLTASDSLQQESNTLSTKADSVAQAGERMNNNMISVAAASEQAATNLSLVAETAAHMKSAMENVLDHCRSAMEVSNAATTQVQTTADQVSELGESAREITKVTEVITEIADQTNLLALNATIEAARAGEAGKGFAVVANEIKALANQTQAATQDIRNRIDAIRTSTDSSVDEVKRITQVISDVDAIMSTINTSISEQADKTSDLALNIEQASEGISEVNENVAQTTQVSADIARDISEVSKIAHEMEGRSNLLRNSSQSLTDLSTQLREMINVFKVADDAAEEGRISSAPTPDLFPWSSQLAFGLKDIDGQHRKLVNLVNDLHRAMKQNKGMAVSGGIIDELVEYTAGHFAFEEELFDRFGYQEATSHKELHAKLVARVVAFRKDFHEGRAGLSMELMQFLTEWLRDHILKTDKRYVEFLKSKGM